MRCYGTATSTVKKEKKKVMLVTSLINATASLSKVNSTITFTGRRCGAVDCTILECDKKKKKESCGDQDDK
ncbi:hypothetical protein ILYODFUR_031338 [Ilyodon furcidens]|uniref:Uncharacterized protein n=1 Tax=Ilyodon furcidens TaxID=33524 RepID=A0ABV0U0Z7_9TELE